MMTRTEQMLSMRRNGSTLADVCSHFGISRQRVCPLLGHTGRPVRFPELADGRRLAQAQEAGLSPAAIAEMVGCQRALVDGSGMGVRGTC